VVGPEEFAPTRKELDSAVAGVGHGDIVSAARNGHAPWIVELSVPVAVLSEGQEEASFRSEDLDPVVVLVRDEDPVSSGVVGDSSGAVELSKSRAAATKGLDKVTLGRVNENLVLKTICNENLKTRINKRTGISKLKNSMAKPRRLMDAS
jgi:hypothetical protein